MTNSRQVAAIYKLKVLILRYQTYKKLTYKILNALKKIVALLNYARKPASKNSE